MQIKNILALNTIWPLMNRQLLMSLIFFGFVQNIHMMQAMNGFTRALRCKAAASFIQKHPECDISSGNNLIDGATGILSGSVGVVAGAAVGVFTGLVAGEMIYLGEGCPPCSESKSSKALSYTVPVAAAMGGLIGSAMTGPAGVASFGTLMTGSYVYGRSRREALRKSSEIEAARKSPGFYIQ